MQKGYHAGNPPKEKSHAYRSMYGFHLLNLIHWRISQGCFCLYFYVDPFPQYECVPAPYAPALAW